MLDKLNFERSTTISFFETVIRILGGLAAAADLSGDAALAAKAVDLADRLLPAFSSSPTGAGQGGREGWARARCCCWRAWRRNGHMACCVAVVVAAHPACSSLGLQP